MVNKKSKSVKSDRLYPPSFYEDYEFECFVFEEDELNNLKMIKWHVIEFNEFKKHHAKYPGLLPGDIASEVYNIRTYHESFEDRMRSFTSHIVCGEHGSGELEYVGTQHFVFDDNHYRFIDHYEDSNCYKFAQIIDCKKDDFDKRNESGFVYLYTPDNIVFYPSVDSYVPVLEGFESIRHIAVVGMYPVVYQVGEEPLSNMKVAYYEMD